MPSSPKWELSYAEKPPKTKNPHHQQEQQEEQKQKSRDVAFFGLG